MAQKSILKSLTMDQKREAFEKARVKFNVLGAKLLLITEEYYDVALKFAKEHYIQNELLNKLFGMSWNGEVEEFRLKLLTPNLSLMIIDEESGEPIAILTNSVDRIDDIIDPDSIKTQPFKEYNRYSDFCDEQADFFGHFGIAEAFHVSGIAVADKYKQRGFATHIFNAAIVITRNFGIDPVYIKVEGTSNFSKNIFEKVNFEILFEQTYATWEVEGKFPIQTTGIHKSLKVYGKKLSA